MEFREMIRLGLTSKGEKQREADAIERRAARTKDGPLRRRRHVGPVNTPTCVNCGTAPALGCTECPTERFAS